jgi:hypothetical protein
VGRRVVSPRPRGTVSSRFGTERSDCPSDELSNGSLVSCSDFLSASAVSVSDCSHQHMWFLWEDVFRNFNVSGNEYTVIRTVIKSCFPWSKGLIKMHFTDFDSSFYPFAFMQMNGCIRASPPVYCNRNRNNKIGFSHGHESKF